MKQKSIVAEGITSRSFVILGLSVIIGLGIFGVEIGRAVRTGREFDRYLTVKGLSEREAKANLAIWPIRFSVSAEDLSGLKTAMESNGALVLDYLKSSGIDAKEITQGLPEIADREDERIQMNRPALSRYKAVVTFVIRSAGVDLVKKAIQGVDALLEKGVTLDGGGQQTEFIFNELNAVKPEMIQEATANARAAAEKFAQDSHSRVGRIRKANQGLMEIENRDAASPEVKVLRIVTTVDFFLE
ncbi:MAG TPA: SIMPL domain-containing protein [Verrucomicrobiae bacterium]